MCKTTFPKYKIFQILVYNNSMEILDNFEAWADLDKPHTPPNSLWLEDKWATQIFKEEVCNNCGCKN